jgi:hypothetical protein
MKIEELWNSVYFIEKTERSDIHKYSICNLQFSIPAYPDKDYYDANQSPA